MAVSKRVRFEVLRRDNHACRYCGATAPDVRITLDHVVPTALGGDDSPSNLVAACGDCNSGKTSTSPSEVIVQDVDERAIKWAAAMAQVANERRASREVLAQRYEAFEAEWNRWGWTDWRGDRHTEELPADWKQSVDQFYAAGLDHSDLEELIEAAMPKKVKDTWKYFCGCAWTRIKQNQERALEIVNAAEAADGPYIQFTRELADEIHAEISRLHLEQTGERLAACFCEACDSRSQYCGEIACRMYFIGLVEWQIKNQESSPVPNGASADESTIME